MKKERKRPVNFQLGENAIKEIERIAISRNRTKSEILRMMIDLGIDCHKDIEKVGIIQAVDFSHFVKKSLRDKLKRPEAQQLHLL